MASTNTDNFRTAFVRVKMVSNQANEMDIKHFISSNRCFRGLKSSFKKTLSLEVLHVKPFMAGFDNIKDYCEPQI